MPRPHLVGAEPDPGQRRRTQVGEKDVGPGHEAVRDVDAALGGEVEGDGPLPPVVQFEDRVDRQVASEHAAEVARRIPRRRLDLDHVRAPVGQDAARPGSRHPRTELHQPHARQRPAHAESAWYRLSDGRRAHAAAGVGVKRTGIDS